MTILKPKILRIIKWSLVSAFLVVFVLLSLTIGVKNSTIKELRKDVNYKTEIIDSLQKRNNALSAMDCITVNCTFEVMNKNIFAVSNTVATQIAKETATITRREVISALDSLNQINKN